jgi:hypothetical protein
MTANPFVRTLVGAKKMHGGVLQVPQSEQVGAFSKKIKGSVGSWFGRHRGRPEDSGWGNRRLIRRGELPAGSERMGNVEKVMQESGKGGREDQGGEKA